MDREVVDKTPEPSEHLRLELDMLSDKSDAGYSEANGATGSAGTSDVLVVTGDENMRLYIESCLRPVPGIRLLETGEGTQPDLLVIDAASGDEGRDMYPGVPRVLILEERPGVAERGQIAGSRTPIGIVVTPFDARSLARVALEVMRRT